MVIKILKENSAATIGWLTTIAMWVLYVIGISNAGHWLLASSLLIFILIMYIGSLKEKIRILEEKLDRYKI